MNLEIKDVVGALDANPNEILVRGYLQRYEDGMTVLVVDASNRVDTAHPRSLPHAADTSREGAASR